MFKPSQTERELLSKKSRAYFLIVVKGYSQKEAAKLCEVSQRTMTTWVHKYKWLEKEERKLVKSGGFATLMDGFIKYLEAKAGPSISKSVSNLWKVYHDILRRE